MHGNELGGGEAAVGEGEFDAVADADLVIFMGCRAGSTTTARWEAPKPGQRIVHFDNEQMIKNKTKIVLIGAIIVTTLMNFPRLLIALRESELALQFGLTLGDVFLRSIVMFCFSFYVALHFSIVF